MANEALNAFQQFKDDGNHLLARGTLAFDSPIFKDSDLTDAWPINVSTYDYELDDFGRTRGDVHFDGLNSATLTNAAGLLIRSYTEMVSSSDGNTGAITKQYESVADMVTDEALAEGDIAATQGYYTGNAYGGARYLIVASGTGTNDDYLFHGLGNGLQAQLLDLEDHKNYLAAGAKGDEGSNDTVPMQKVINQGGDIEVQGGFTFVATELEIPLNVVFIGGGTMKQDNGQAADLLQITDSEVSEVRFRGVTLDGNQQNGNQANSTVGWVISGE